MKDYIFIDSNIWIYSLISTSEEKHRKVKAFLEKSFQDYYITISFQVMNEVTFNLKKKGFSEEKIKNIIEAFRENCIIITFSTEILFKASKLREKHSFSFWDSLVVASALSSDATLIYSEDMQDGMIIENRLKILNPIKNPNSC